MAVPAAENNVSAGDAVSLSLRSELLRLLPADAENQAEIQILDGVHLEEVYVGLTTSHLVRLPDGHEILAREVAVDRAEASITPGAEVRVGWRLRDARLHTS